MKRLMVMVLFLGLTSSAWALTAESKALIDQLRAKYSGARQGQATTVVTTCDGATTDPEFCGKAPVQAPEGPLVDPTMSVPTTLNADNALSMPDETPKYKVSKKGKKGKKSKKHGKAKKGKKVKKAK